jgi:hypothetical protein
MHLIFELLNFLIRTLPYIKECQKDNDVAFDPIKYSGGLVI